MCEINLQDREKGRRQVRVERSALISGNAGVFVQVNDHFELPGVKTEDGAAKAMSLLEARFDASIREAKRIVEELMEYGAKL